MKFTFKINTTIGYILTISDYILDYDYYMTTNITDNFINLSNNNIKENEV